MKPLRFAVGLLGVLLAADAEPSAKIADYIFLAGHWTAEIWNGVGEEVWPAPVDGNMIGMFRFQRNGKFEFTEFLTLDETATGVVLHMRHFHPALQAWEEKDEDVATHDGKPEETIFRFKRVK